MIISIRRATAAILILSLLVTGCSRRSAPKPRSVTAPGLVEITADVGLQFEHDPGDLRDFAMPQIMGSGAGLLDYDNDGDLDALLINGGPLVPDGTGEWPKEVRSRLFRQDEDGSFHDVTEAAGLLQSGYGMGMACGDIDNDGDVDLYLTNYGPDQLFENQGDGTFKDITEAAGIRNPQWGTAVSFLDYDNDGWLDLFVVNYVDFLPGSICEDATGRRDYCGPEAFQGTADKLYRNRGAAAEGPRFTDVTVTAGITAHAGKGLGVVCRDYTADGRPDIYVANDMEDNCLWVQQADGTFVNEAHLRGVAVNGLGEPEASMGVLSDDLDGDRHLDIFLTHLSGETNTLYIGDGTGQFVDKTTISGLGAPSRPFTGFGVAPIDLEHDGDLDVVLVNGRVKRGPAAEHTDTAEFWRDYAEPNHVYRNDGEGRFTRSDDASQHSFTEPVEVTRGLAAGDVDNDGDLDVLISNCSGPARLYRNEFPKAGHWLMVRAIDPALHRDAYGAQVTVQVGTRSWTRDLNPSSSYLSSHDVRLHFGLGEAARFDAIRVQWPGQTEEEVFAGGKVDQVLVIERGSGTREDAAIETDGDRS